jgi:hypothetical protein
MIDGSYHLQRSKGCRRLFCCARCRVRPCSCKSTAAARRIGASLVGLCIARGELLSASPEFSRARAYAFRQWVPSDQIDHIDKELVVRSTHPKGGERLSQAVKQALAAQGKAARPSLK